MYANILYAKKMYWLKKKNSQREKMLLSTQKDAIIVKLQTQKYAIIVKPET